MSNLPRPIGAIAAIAHIIGAEAALALAEARGGTLLYIPEAPAPDSPLVGIIGMEAAQALAALKGGYRIKVPIGREWRIVVYRNAGGTYPGIALRLGIDENTVHRVLQQQEMTSRQLRLL